MTGTGDTRVRQADSVPVLMERTFLLRLPQGTTDTSMDKSLGVSCPPSTWANLAGA